MNVFKRSAGIISVGTHRVWWELDARCEIYDTLFEVCEGFASENVGAQLVVGQLIVRAMFGSK